MVCHIKVESIERLLAAVSHRYYGSTYPSPLTASFALTGTHNALIGTHNAAAGAFDDPTRERETVSWPFKYFRAHFLVL